MKEYDERIKELLKDDKLIVPGDDEGVLQDWNNHTELDDEDFAREFNEVISDELIPEVDEDFTPDTIGDAYLEKEVLIPDGADTVDVGRVTKRLRDAEGRPIGVANENPLSMQLNFTMVASNLCLLI